MKRSLLNFFLVSVFMLLGGAALAQVAITYPPSNPVAIGTTYTTATPAATPTTATNVSAFGYGTGVALTTTNISGPWGIAFDGSGNLYVANYTAGTIVKYTAGGGTAASFITGLTNPTGIVFDNTGVPYVSTVTGYVYKFPTTAGPFTLAANGTTVITGGGAATSTTKPSSAYGIAIDQGSPQSIYLADENSGAIWRNTSGTTTRLIFYNTGSNSTYLDYPVGVQVDAAGNIYTLDNTAGLGGGTNKPITKWTSAGASPVSVIAGTTFTSPYGFSMDKSGNFYVSDLAGTNSSKIYSFNSSAATLATTIAITTTGTATRGVTTDASGNLFVSDYGLSKITKYPIVGGYLLNFGTSTTTLPPGIIFSSTNGKFTGTPTTAFTGNYTVTAYGTGTPSTATSSQFTITCATAPAFTYTNPPAYTVGTTITNVSPNITAGGPLTNATSSPGLPSGLTINTSGVISGTPTAVTASQVYTITGTNASGLTGTATITIVVKPPAPAFSYTNPPAYTVGVAITPVAPSVTSNGPITSASSSPTLPAGLSIDATGTISGTPTAVTASAVYTITAGNSSGGSGTATITIVVNPPAPALTYANTTFTVGTAQSLTPTYGGGYVPSSCTISPSLPAGLSISNAGVISGTPTAVSASTSYTVTATNAGGTAASNSFTIVVNPAKPALTYTPTNPYTVGTTITITPTNTGGPPSSCTLSPALANFSVDNMGVITGNPTVASTGTYSVSSTNISGTTTSNSFTITVNQPAPVISYTTPNTYTVGATVNLPVTNNHSAVTTGYAVTAGALPTGITLNASTGLISGTANTLTAAVTATITASTGSSSGSTTVTITVNDVAPSSITYSPATNVYTVGVAITPLTPSVTGNIPAKFVYPAPTPAFNNPWGMGLNPSNRLLVTNNGNNYVDIYTPAGAFSSSINTGVAIKGIVFDATGNAYIAKTNGDVVQYDNTGALVGTINLPTSSAWGIAIDASNNLYIADRSASQVYKYNITSATGAYITTTGIAKPVNVAIDASGNLYVLDNTNLKVSKYSSSGGAAISTPVTGLTTPYGLSVDAAGNIYVGDSGTNSVKIYTSTGTLITTLSNITDPRGVLVDSQGSIYVSDFTNNTVTKYPPMGGFTISPSGLPPGITFDTNSGTFSGTPTAAFSAVTYTVKVYNSGGSASTSPPAVTLSCVVTPPVITYNPPPTPPATGYSFPVNAAITPLVPTNSGGPIYSTTYGTTGNQVMTGLTAPSALAIDGSGNVYTVSKTTGLVTEYNVTTGTTSNPFTAAVNAIGIAFDSSNNAYVLTTTTLIKYTNSGGVFTAAGTTFTGLSTPLSVTIAGNVIYVANNNGSTGTNTSIVSFITEYSTSGGAPTLKFNTNGYNYPAAGGIAVNGSTIYLVDNTGGTYIDTYTTGGTYQSAKKIDANSIGIDLDVDANGNIYLTETTTATLYTSAYATIIQESGFSSAKAVISDNKGDFFVADGTTGIVYEYSALNYNLTIPSGKTLPPGIIFNTNNGTFSGTPTSAYGPVTYSVTANGYSGSTSTPPNQITITCYVSYDWVGTTSTDWNVITNWESKTIPTATNDAYVGVNFPFTNLPVVQSANAVAKSLTFGNKGGTSGAAKLAGVTVNTGYNLTVSGPINKQSDANSAVAYYSTLAGAGAITATGINVLQNPTATATYSDGIYSSATTLTVNGDVSVTSTTSPFASNLQFGVLSGTTAINGNVNLTSTGSSSASALYFGVNGGTASVTGTLNTANSAGSTSNFLVSGSGTLQLLNAAPLTNTLSTLGTNVVTFSNAGATVEYAGASQTVYTDASLQGLATGPSYNHIKFSGSGIKTPNGTTTNTLFVAGNFTNTLANTAASNVALSGTVVNFNGGAIGQILYGGAGPTYSATSTTAPPTVTGTAFGSVIFSNSGTKYINTGGFTVASSGTLTMAGTATLTVNPGSSLTLNSDANGSATVAAIPSGTSITGAVNVQRFITGGTGYRSYRLMSSPVYGSSQTNGSVTTNIYSLNYLMSGIYLRGTSGTGFDGTGNDNVFLYRENITPSNSSFTGGNYNGLNSMVTTYPALSYNYPFDGAPNPPPSTYGVPVGDGFLVYFRGDRKADSYANETVSGYTPQNAVITATGTLNQGNVSPIDWYTPSSPYLGYTAASPTSVQGFNLVGNPYASSIDWDTFGTGITATNVSNTVYELNPKTQNFDTYQAGTNGGGAFTGNGSHIVVSGQGIFVVAGSGANPQITFTEAAKTNTQVVNPTLMMATRGDVAQLNRMKADKNQHLRLELALDSVNVQDVYVAFATTAKTGYVFNEDAQYKQGTGKVSLSSYSSDNVQLAINRTVLSKSMVIRLNVGAVADGTYKFNMLDLANIPAKYDIWLKDAKLNDSVAMTTGASYSFSIALADTTTYGANRFSLIIKDDPALRIKLLDFAATKVAKTAEINWTVKNEGSNAVFVVERSTDKGATFDDIGTLASNGLGKYAFTDKNPVMPEDRYRLKLINADSTINYSKVATLTYSLNDGGVAKSRIIVFPNPATTTVNMAILQNTGILDGALNYLGESLINDHFQKPDVKPVKASYNIKVFNSLGSVVRDVTSTEPVWQTNVSSLLPGTYVIQVTNTTDNTSVGKSTFVKL